jgi:hypothetical protein
MFVTVQLIIEVSSIHRNPERNVWVTAGRHPRERIVTTTIISGWMPSDQSYARNMETQNATDVVLFSSGLFWNQVRWM